MATKDPHEKYIIRDLYTNLIYCKILITLILFLQKIGAINNIVRRQDGTLKGYNTDYIGAIEAIEDGLRGLYHHVVFGRISVLILKTNIVLETRKINLSFKHLDKRFV